MRLEQTTFDPRHAEQLLEQLRTENAAQAQEITELKARVERLHHCLEYKTGFRNTRSDIFQATNIKALLKEAPTQSLQAIKAEVEEEMVERCWNYITAVMKTHSPTLAVDSVWNMPRLYNK